MLSRVSKTRNTNDPYSPAPRPLRAGSFFVRLAVVTSCRAAGRRCMVVRRAAESRISAAAAAPLPHSLPRLYGCAVSLFPRFHVIRVCPFCAESQRRRGECGSISRISVVFPIPVRAGRGSLLPSPIALRWVSWFNNHLFCAKSSRNMDFCCKGQLLFKASRHWNRPICPGKTEGKNSDAVSCRWFLPSF